GGDRPSMLGRVGSSAIAVARSAVEVLAFIGEACVGVLRLLTGQARFQRSELLLVVQEAGAQALPIVSLITFLVGVILAYVGGAAVGVGLLHLGGLEYYQRSLGAITLDDFAAGLIKASVFGVLVAIAGCLRGMQSGRTSAAVGAAATSAVVTGIVLIIVSDAVMTVLFDLLHL